MNNLNVSNEQTQNIRSFTDTTCTLLYQSYSKQNSRTQNEQILIDIEKNMKKISTQTRQISLTYSNLLRSNDKTKNSFQRKIRIFSNVTNWKICFHFFFLLLFITMNWWRISSINLRKIHYERWICVDSIVLIDWTI